MASIDRLAREVATIRQEVRSLATTPRLARSSIDGGSLEIRDIEGNVTGYVGEQYDGTFTVAPVGGTYPAEPSIPLVTPIQGGLKIYWDGTYADNSVTRMDFKRVTFHAVTDILDLDLLSPSQIVGEVTIATGGEVTISLPPVEHFVVAVTWTESGKFSVESEVAFGTPLPMVDPAAFDEVLEEIVDLQADVADAPAVFRQTTEPIVAEGKKAIWFNTSPGAGNVASFFDGTDWTVMPVGAGAIAADAVIASTIAAGALDGKTITGPLIQTHAAADTGIKLVTDSLVAFDASGDPTFLLDGADGSVSMVGPLISGGEISGAVITGATLRTATTPAERIEIGTHLGSLSRVQFFSGNANELDPSWIQADDVYYGNANTPHLVLQGGTRTGFPGTRSPARLSLLTRSTNLTEAETIAQKVFVSARDKAVPSSGDKLADLIVDSTTTDPYVSMAAGLNGSSFGKVEVRPNRVHLSGTVHGALTTSPVNFGAPGITIDSKPIFLSASGSAFAAGPTGSVAITFPVGRFTAAPMVQATVTVGGNVAVIANVGSITTTGCIAYLYGVGGAWTSGPISVFWHAQQSG